MKKLLSALAIAAASTALAVESSNTFGILRVDSSAAQTIVSIPWEAAGGGSIKVKDVVKTANLTPASDDPTYIGDQLYYYDTTAETPAYKMWHLTSTGWEGATTVANGITPTAGTETDTLTRGGALILVRKNPSVPFYLYGQYTDVTPESITMAKGATAANFGYTLIAPPSVNETDLNENVTWSNVQAGDKIFITDGTGLSWNATEHKWGVRSFDAAQKKSVYNYNAAKISAGCGAWYLCQGNPETAPSVTWSKSQSAE